MPGRHDHQYGEQRSGWPGRQVRRCENCDKVSFVSFQPVSFTGRDEDISDEERHAKRYTLSHLAEDMKRQTGVTEPLRDWFPLSASSAFPTSPT